MRVPPGNMGRRLATRAGLGRLELLPQYTIIDDEPENEEQQNEPETASVIQSSDNSDQEEVEDIFITQTQDMCCWTPDILSITRLDVVIDYLNQFQGNMIDLDCLHYALNICSKTFEIISESSFLPGQIGLVIKSLSKFRHDSFAYVFLTETVDSNIKFGTDCQFPPEAESNRTPDFIYEKDGILNILEFTIVYSKNTANFLKGVTKYDSKYSVEIKKLEQAGFRCEYFPIALVTSDTIDNNESYWLKQGFEINDSVKDFLNKFMSIYNLSDNSLLGMMFDSYYFQPGTIDNQIIGNKWDYKIVRCNKSRFYEFWFIFQRYDFNEGKYYKYNTKKTLYIREGYDTTGDDYWKCMELKNNQIKFYERFKDILRGKEIVYLHGETEFFDNKVYKSSHGIIKPTESYERNDKLTSLRKDDLFKADQIESIIAKTWTFGNSSLAQELNLEHLEISLKKFTDSRQRYLFENYNTIPPILNDRRKSFYNMFNAQESSIVEIGEPMLDWDLNYSLSAQKLLRIKDQANYSSEVVESIDPHEKEEFRSLIVDIHKLIRNVGFKSGNFKGVEAYLRINNHPDLERFKTLRDKLKIEQTQYQKKIKKNNRGICRIGKDIQTIIKQDMNWNRDSAYRLAMCQESTIEDLSIAAFASAYLIPFNLEQPESYDIEFFTKLKDSVKSKLNKILPEITQTNLFQWMLFHSRLCYTVLAASNRNFNKNYVMFDNLGLNNVCLIVKGGKKITTTRKSKIFKIIYPCLNEAFYWQQKKYIRPGKVTKEESPWMQLSQSELLDGIALPYKMLQNYFYIRNKNTFEETKSMLILPSLLALSNRRSTEKNIHNMRYLIVNAMGVLSQVGLMLEDFAKPAYTNLELCIYNGLQRQYLNYYKTINEWTKLKDNSKEIFKNSKIQHPYLARNIISIDDLTYIIYSTYMMSIGQYDQSLEQVLNLESVAETHMYYNSNKQKLQIVDEFDSAESLYSNDFNYSPALSYAVGKILSADLRNKHAQTAIHMYYNKVRNTPLDDMANNRGLRFKDENFFGHKGYYVVYKTLFDEGLDDILAVLSSDLSEQKKYLRLSELNITYAKKQQEHELKQVIFHIVDKKQRAGGREIYVMDYSTKLYQRGIELMFKKICEYIDNEIITIPSSKRASLIYRNNFEYMNDNYTTYYLSYDCRKWAPRSNPDKYLWMLKGLSDVLPVEFVNSVEHYFSKHKTKQIHTRKEIFSKLVQKNEALKDFMIDDNTKGSSYFTMEYSFVMGIFNMLSSLYHAGVQLICKKYIEEKNFSIGIRTNFDMLAHSDDSAGRISYDTRSILKSHPQILDIVKKDLSFYQHIQKSCNHLMSVKKCNTSLSYFELLSTLFINREFMTVMPKFLSNFSGSFTSKGISSDFKQIISKSIEIQSNGGDASTAYATQLILSKFYRNFYRVNADFGLPSFGGTADSWPTLYTAYGSAADEIRLCLTHPQLYSRILSWSKEHLDYELENGTINLKMSNVIRTPKAYKELINDIQLPDFQDSEWFFQQNKTSHAKLNVLWFRAMLSNKDFQVSLLNINEVRRYFDTLYMASSKNIIGKTSMYNINDVTRQILLWQDQETEYFDFIKKLYYPLVEFYEIVDNLGEFELQPKILRSLKPCTLNLDNFATIPVNEYKSFNLAVEICRPELKSWLFSRKSYQDEAASMWPFIEKLGIPKDIKLIKSFLDFAAKYKSTVISLYIDAPKTKRIYKNDEGLFEVICQTYSSEQIIRPNTRYLAKHKSYDVVIPDKIKQRVSIQLLKSLSKKIFDESLQFAVVEYNGKKYYLKDADAIETDDFGQQNSFINLIGSFEGKVIDLNSYNGWAYWTERQYKIGEEWVGDGKLRCRIMNFEIDIFVHNESIKFIETEQINEMLFDSYSSVFINLLFSKLNLKFEPTISTLSNVKYFGLNNNSSIGFHHYNEIIIGCPIYPFRSIREDVSKCSYLYHSGKHVLTINNNNYSLETLDKLIIEREGLSCFNVIDWNSVNPEGQSGVLLNILSGDWGLNLQVDFFKEEITTDVQSSEIYKFVYNKIIKPNYKEKFSNIIWADMITNVSSEEDFLPLIYEYSAGLELQKLIPQEGKDTINLLSFFKEQPNELYNLRELMSSADTDSRKTEVLVRSLIDLGVDKGLATLPDIGNPKAFGIWDLKNRSLASPHWINCAMTLANSLYLSLMSAKSRFQMKMRSILKCSLKYEDLLTFIISNPYQPVSEFNDFEALSLKTMVLHEILEYTFENKVCLLDFTRSIRSTVLSNVPRHPRYKEEWHILLANCIKYFRISKFSTDMYFPSEIIRKYKRAATITDIVNKPMSLIFNIVFENDLTLNGYQAEMEGLNTFSTNVLKYEEEKNLVEDYADDIEEEFEFIRNHEGHKPTVINTERTVYTDSSCVAYPYFIPLRSVYFDKNNLLYYYNLNQDIANQMGLIQSDFKFERSCQKKYLGYYASEIKMTVVKELTLPTIDQSIDLRHDVFAKLYNLHDPTSYNENLVNILMKNYQLDNKVKPSLMAIVESNKFPLRKATELRQTILSFMNKPSSLTDMISQAFQSFDSTAFKVMESEDNFLKLINSSVEKKAIILKSTSYKVEIKQLEALFGHTIFELVSKNIVLSDVKKKHYINTIKIMINHYKSKRKTNETCLLRIIRSIIDSVEIGQTNSWGERLEEKIQEYISTLEIPEEEEESLDEVDEPKDSVKKFRLNLLNRR